VLHFQCIQNQKKTKAKSTKILKEGECMRTTERKRVFWHQDVFFFYFWIVPSRTLAWDLTFLSFPAFTPQRGYPQGHVLFASEKDKERQFIFGFSLKINWN